MPAFSTIISSRSWKGTFSSSATFRPTVDLPDPIMPHKKTGCFKVNFSIQKVFSAPPFQLLLYARAQFLPGHPWDSIHISALLQLPGPVWFLLLLSSTPQRTPFSATHDGADTLYCCSSE